MATSSPPEQATTSRPPKPPLLRGFPWLPLLGWVALTSSAARVPASPSAGAESPSQHNRAAVEAMQMGAITEAYRRAALSELMREATLLAARLSLPEKLPIESQDLVEASISPPFWSDSGGLFGWLATS